nr:hypothetical protein [Rhodococcus sp. (in: high G+C Gram-positive bacteria)]
MPTYVLEGTGRAVFPRKPVVVSLTVSGSASGADMHALVDGVADSRAVRPTPGLMVLPRIDALTILRITPAGVGGEFAPGTSLHLSLTVEDRSDPDPDRAVIGPIDVSGESHVDVASLDSALDGIAVSALRSEPDLDLGPVGNIARSVTRLELGVDQLPESVQVDLDVAVDCSASMLAALADGSIEEVCNMVAGIATVAAPQRIPRICMVGDSPRWIEVDSLSNLGPTVVRELSQALLVSGFRSSSIPRGDQRGTTTTFVITDGVPADATRDLTDQHFVAIMSDSDNVDSDWADAVTVVHPPPGGTSAVVHLTASRDALAATVRSLVSKAVPNGVGGTRAVAR